MTLRGEYSNLKTYNVGDVVQCEEIVYVLRKPCKAGTTPTDTTYWERLPQILADAVDMILDALDIAHDNALAGKVANNLTTTTAGKVLDARKGKDLKDMLDLVNPDSKTIRLASSTASSKKVFDITVNDSGEISATEYTPAT